MVSTADLLNNVKRYKISWYNLLLLSCNYRSLLTREFYVSIKYLPFKVLWFSFTFHTFKYRLIKLLESHSNY